jgi:hypothetical protein
MQGMGPTVYLAFIALMMALIAAYAMYRMTKRPTVSTGPMAPISMVAGTQVSAEMAQDFVSGQAAAEVKQAQ